MSKKISGVETPFKDKDGKVIRVHDYVKDAQGNRYYVNSHCQAVPDGGDAPAKELSRLLDESPVSVMTMEEVLKIKEPIAPRRRGGRRKEVAQNVVPEDSPSPEKVEAEARAAAEAQAAEEARLAAIAAAKVNNEDLHPVTKEMLLRVLPDDMLANELRRRGYTLCAVRPALIEL